LKVVKCEEVAATQAERIVGLMAPKIWWQMNQLHMLRFMQHELEQEGYQLLRARDGHEVIETALRERPDLMILDILMPKMDGLAALRRLKKEQNTGRSGHRADLQPARSDASGGRILRRGPDPDQAFQSHAASQGNPPVGFKKPARRTSRFTAHESHSALFIFIDACGWELLKHDPFAVISRRTASARLSLRL